MTAGFQYQYLRRDIFNFIYHVIPYFQGGYHLFQIMDTNVGGYPMLIVGIIECIVLGWVYGRLFLDYFFVFSTPLYAF